MRVAVTGGTGHIGGNLVRALLARGDTVRVLVHEATAAIDGLDVERVTGDVRNLESLRPLCDGVEVLYHLAGCISIDGDRGGLVQEVNVEGTRNVVTAALEARVRRMIHTSSIHAFDMTPGRPVTEESPRASSPGHSAYDRSKAVGEEQVRQGLAQGLDAVIVHPTGVIGRWDFRPSRMGAFFLMLHGRKLPALIEGGFDWVDVQDLVASMVAAVDRGRTGESYNLPGRWASVREVADLAAQITGVPCPRWSTPQWLARVGAPFAVIGARVLRADPLYTPESLAALRSERRVVGDKAARELGHAPRPLRSTIEDLYRCFRERGVIAASAVANVDRP